MGSSILASLSEAGGNDPYHPVNGPFLPVHLTMRTVSERDPHPEVVQLGYLRTGAAHDEPALKFQ